MKTWSLEKQKETTQHGQNTMYYYSMRNFEFYVYKWKVYVKNYLQNYLNAYGQIYQLESLSAMAADYRMVRISFLLIWFLFTTGRPNKSAFG